CPRAPSRSGRRATWSLTSWPPSHGTGVTWAMGGDISSGACCPTGGWQGGGRGEPSGLRLGAGRSLAAHGAALDRLARVLGDELLGRLARLVIGALVVRRLHEVRARTVDLAAEAVVEPQLAAAHGVGDDARRVRRVPDLELHLHVERHIAEGLALEADVRPLAIGQPRHVVRRADVD